MPPPDPVADPRVDLLRRAVALYLPIAYPDGPPPEAVRRRLAWPDGVSADDLLGRPPFERSGKPDAGRAIFALRLGNAWYPHMKLQIQPWSNGCGCLLSVNTHDQVLALEPGSADAAAFRALQADNQRIKEAIEASWDAAGLPTFLRYLRDYLRDHPGGEEA